MFNQARFFKSSLLTILRKFFTHTNNLSQIIYVHIVYTRIEIGMGAEKFSA